MKDTINQTKQRSFTLEFSQLNLLYMALGFAAGGAEQNGQFELAKSYLSLAESIALQQDKQDEPKA